MTASKIQILLEVKHDAAIRRWLLSAIVPVGVYPSTFNVSGDAVFAEHEMKLRSSKYAFSTSRSEVRGKICVCDSINERSTDEAMIYASDFGAQALLGKISPTSFIFVVSKMDFYYTIH